MRNAVVLLIVASLNVAATLQAADPLPSWNDGAAKSAITNFVEKVTTEGSPDFVPPAERVATFDNDGTLWSEQPFYFQLAFALARVKALAPDHPEWKNQQPFKGVLEGDLKAVMAGGEKSLLEIIAATHAGNTTEEFAAIVTDWITTAKHPQTGKLYSEMVYQPMLELLAYLRASGFKTFIVSGGGIEFMRPWAERVYGIPPEQVVGSSIKTKYEVRDGKPVILRLPEINFIDDKEGKPVGIHQHIGRRPIFAAGNSDGDFQMLEWTTSGSGPRFALIVHHDDADREWAYDRDSHIGQLKRGLDEGPGRGWTIVSMQDDWNRIYRDQSVTAIDILLEPDATMQRRAAVVNARLRESFPQCFPLDASHRPHITLLQCFVRTDDLDSVCRAAEKVLAAFDLTDWKLEAFKHYYIPNNDTGVAGIVVKPTDELTRLQAELITAVAPFTVETGTSGAFVTTPDDLVIDPALIAYVSTFVPKSSGDRFNPHVTTGVASRSFLDNLLSEPFDEFEFAPASAAVYQLGQFGTAARKLKELKLNH